MKKYLVLPLVLMSILLISACNSDTPPDLEDRINNSSEPTKSTTTYTGVIETFSLNLYQDGTHQIRTSDDKVIVIQSAKINLNAYLDKKVTINGSTKKLIDTQGEVFNVTKIKLDDSEGGETISYNSQKATFSFDYPQNWQLTEEIDELIFQANGVKWVTIKTYNEVDESLADFLQEKEREEGTSVTVGTRQSRRFIDLNQIRVYVPHESRKKVYQITFYDEGSDAEVNKDLFYALLETFLPKSSQSSAIKGDACGGEDNLICPENFRCELEGNEENALGSCIQLDQEAITNDCPFVPIPKGCSHYEIKSKNKNECPLSYVCLDAGWQESSDSAASASTTDSNDESKESAIEAVSASFLSHQAKILPDNAQLSQLEIAEEQSLLVAIYKLEGDEFRTLFEYAPAANEFNYVQVAHYEAGEERDWVLIEGKEIVIKADRQVIPLNGGQAQVIPKDKRLYESTRYDFTLFYPKDWYYKSFGSIENSVWTGGFSIAQLEDIVDAEITVSIQDNPKETKSQIKADRYLAIKARDESTHFEIEGPLSSKETIDSMADSLSMSR